MSDKDPFIMPLQPAADFLNPIRTVRMAEWEYSKAPAYIGLTGAAVLWAAYVWYEDHLPPPPPSPMGGVVRVAQEAGFQTHSQEAHTVANRYDNCSLVGPVVLTRRMLIPGERSPRDTIAFSIDTQRNPEGQAAETKYKEDDTVMWESGIMAHLLESEHGQPVRGNEIQNTTGNWPFPSTVEKDPSSVKLYPKANYQEGTEIAVSVYTTADAIDFNVKKVHRESDVMFCGVLRRIKDADGHLQWEAVAASSSLPFPDIIQAETNALVETSPGSNVYTEQPLHPI